MGNGSEEYKIDARGELRRLVRELAAVAANVLLPEELAALRRQSRACRNAYATADHLIPQALLTMQTASTFASQIEPDRNCLLAIACFRPFREGLLSLGGIAREWGDDVAELVEGLSSVNRFAGHNVSVDQDNFRGLLLALARDIRVIIIMIVNNLVVMRLINHHPDTAWVRSTAFEANCLYAQLAHRLGLYKIKGELEDLSLKYTNRDIYTQIARRLNETKRSRDAYIASFIGPVREKLLEAGLKFDIKGRTKSISSIWAKIQKQRVDIQHIYDLFAIRVIIDTPREREKSDCWLAYSILADMYRANPARMKDWITIPKSNGYESLHATVMGPGSKWVEVQFRTRRMDLVAEKGLAAHWRYKGGKGDSTDQWMNNVRDILESADAGPMQLMKGMKTDVFGKEVFVFTPKGDLFRLSAGATVLDFAFHIHTRIGSQCTGANVNGRHERITYKLRNGDTVEILTSAQQKPKQDWLGFVVTSKARNKIRQSLNEEQLRKAELGKEMLERRIRNRKVEIDEAEMSRRIKKMGYKQANDFFADLADEKIDPGRFISSCLETKVRDEEAHVAAEKFRIRRDEEALKQDVVVIGDHSLKGLNYKFARCCNPIFGDRVFGFVSADGIVKIHKEECPNARNIARRYPYRTIPVQWGGRQGNLMPAQIKVVGIDDIGIVTNITSIITKEPDTLLRNISIDSHDGMFQGYLVIHVRDRQQLSRLIKKVEGVKGVKGVTRI